MANGPTPCLARRARPRGYVVIELNPHSGFGNKLCLLWRALEVALLLNRALWVHMSPDVHEYIAPDPALRGLVRWELKPPPGAASDLIPYEDLVPARRVTSPPSLNTSRHIELSGVPQEFPGWRDEDAGFLPELPCLALHILRPRPSIEAAVNALLAKAKYTVAMHVRTTDADMVDRMTGRDDILARTAQIFSALPFIGRRLRRLAVAPTPPLHARADVARRHLGLALGGVKPGCDRDAGNLSLVADCAERLGGHRASEGSTRDVMLFEASDSSATDAWFRSRVAGLVQTEGVPVHTGREIDDEHKSALAKVSSRRVLTAEFGNGCADSSDNSCAALRYTSTSSFCRAPMRSCPTVTARAPTSQMPSCCATARAPRGARARPAYAHTCTRTARATRARTCAGARLGSYRAVDCSRLRPYPSHTHVDWKNEAGGADVGSMLLRLRYSAPGLALALCLFFGCLLALVCVCCVCRLRCGLFGRYTLMEYVKGHAQYYDNTALPPRLAQVAE